MEKEFGKDRKNCLCVVSWRETTRVAKRSRVSCVRECQGRKGQENEERAFKKGRPRFVVFIMCEEEAWGEASSCIVGDGERRERKERKKVSGLGEALSDEDEMSVLFSPVATP